MAPQHSSSYNTSERAEPEDGETARLTAYMYANDSPNDGGVSDGASGVDGASGASSGKGSVLKGALLMAVGVVVALSAASSSSTASSSAAPSSALEELTDLTDCSSVSIATNYSTDYLSNDWYIVASSDSDECDFVCDHAKWTYDTSNEELTQYVLHWKDDAWDGMTRTYDSTSTAGEFTTDTGDFYVYHIGDHEGYTYIISWTCGDYFKGVEVYYTGSQSVDDSFLDKVGVVHPVHRLLAFK
mmetsp:Transcript_14501/g.38237  ORF Transcript_14501/g.38237 Transcript_14501/m.38237 type:complete len:243 (-) Transcript_14501:50-778(-)